MPQICRKSSKYQAFTRISRPAIKGFPKQISGTCRLSISKYTKITKNLPLNIKQLHTKCVLIGIFTCKNCNRGAYYFNTESNTKPEIEKMKFFTNCKSVEEAKLEYRRLAKLHHPDMGGDLATMQALNAQFEDVLKGIWRAEGHSEETCQNKYAACEETMRQAHEISKVSADISVEVCGVWVWVKGDTKPHKEALKELGCRWSQDKLAWYWKPEWSKKSSRRTWSMDEIKSRFGSQKVSAEDFEGAIH